MQVKIIATGEPMGTSILMEDGQDLKGYATAVRFHHEGGQIPVLEIVMGLVPIEIDGIVARMVGPDGREILRVEYADGTADEFEPEQPRGTEIHRVVPLTGVTRHIR